MKNFIHYITQRYLKDVVVTGYIDFKHTHIFHPRFERLFFIFDMIIYEIYINNSGLILIRMINLLSTFQNTTRH